MLSTSVPIRREASQGETTQLSNLFVLDRNGGEPKQLTHFNDALLARLNLTAPEEIHYKSFDGKMIEAWLSWMTDPRPGTESLLI